MVTRKNKSFTVGIYTAIFNDKKILGPLNNNFHVRPFQQIQLNICFFIGEKTTLSFGSPRMIKDE